MRKWLFGLLVLVPLLSVNADLKPEQSLNHSRKIDAFVKKLLTQEKVKQGAIISDERFLKRVYIDIAGRIPTLDEYDAFMSSRKTNKRHELIDELIESRAHNSHMANYWLDALRATSKLHKTSGEPYVQWVRNAVSSNMPYDQFAKALVGAQGYIYHPEQASVGYYIRDYRMPEESVSTTMQLFLGTSMVCAQCHDHPFSEWSQMDFYKLLAFMNETKSNGRFLPKEYQVLFSGNKSKENKTLVGPDGKKLKGKDREKAKQMAEMKTSLAKKPETKKGNNARDDKKKKSGKNKSKGAAKAGSVKVAAPDEGEPEKKTKKKSNKNGKKKGEKQGEKQPEPENPIAKAGQVGKREMASKGAMQMSGGMAMSGGRRGFNPSRDFRMLYKGVFTGGSGKVKLPADYKYEDGKPHEVISADVPFGDHLNLDYSKQYKSSLPYHIKALGKNTPDVHARKKLAEWIASPDNPMFTKTIVNRMWARVFGAPLIGPLLDIEESQNGPSPELTAYLIDVMKKTGYDLKAFRRILYRTELYQRECVDITDINATYHLEGPVLQRLSAEQLWDSLLAIRVADPERGVDSGSMLEAQVVFMKMLGLDEKGKYEFVTNQKQRAQLINQNRDKIQRSDARGGDVRVSLMSSPAPLGSFMEMFGQSQRDIIDGYYREGTMPQALILMNDTSLLNIQADSALFKKLGAEKGLSDRAITLAFQATLVRTPSPSEISLVKRVIGGKGDVKDVIWALINTDEFKIKR